MLDPLSLLIGAFAIALLIFILAVVLPLIFPNWFWDR